MTAGMAVLFLFSMEPSLYIYEHYEAVPRDPTPSSSSQQQDSFRNRRSRQGLTSRMVTRLGMVPRSSLRTPLVHPVDTLQVVVKPGRRRKRSRTQTVGVRLDHKAVSQEAQPEEKDEAWTQDVDDDDDRIATTLEPDVMVASTIPLKHAPRVVILNGEEEVFSYTRRTPATGRLLPKSLFTPLEPLLLDDDEGPIHMDISIHDIHSYNDNDNESIVSLPYEREFMEECEVMTKPQVHPTCNHLHELTMQDDNTAILSTKGSWRTAWTVQNDTAVLKVLQYDRIFDTESYERHALDVVVSDVLTASPYVIDAYGFCGQSIVQEWAPSGARDFVKSYEIRNRQRLKIARDLARGLADLQALTAIPHNSFRDPIEKVTRAEIPPPLPLLFSHNDINIANTIYSESRQVIKWNDFNIGVLLRARKGSNFTQDCGAPVKFRADLWRSPEEVRNSSFVQLPYADMYGFGNILYQVMTRHQPWTHKEPEGQLTATQVADRKRHGRLPTMPEKYLNTTNKDLQILLLATMSCYHPNPTERPTAYELSHALSYLYDRLQAKLPVPSSMIRQWLLRR